MQSDEPENNGRRISEEMFRKLGPIAAAMGIDLDVQSGERLGKATAPMVDVRKTISEVILEVGQIVRHEGLFVQADNVVTIDPEGKVETMTDKNFISWIERHCVVCNGKDEDGKPKRVSMTSKRAGEILGSSMFKAMLPEVTRVLPAMLPVFIEDRKGVRLLPRGYDPEHKVFVTGNAPHIVTMTLAEATTFFRELLGGFEWGDPGRSLAAQISGMIGNFVQLLFPDALAVPMYYYNANMEGSGKSILAEMTITPLYGYCLTDDFDEGDEFKKMLAVKVGSYSSYLFLDDVDGFIKSQTLNRWIVQPRWGYRRMHSHQQVELPKRIMTLISGNGTTLSDDLVRRAVMVDLFATTSAAERLSKRKGVEITSEWLAAPENRSRILSALWAMVKHWSDEKMPAAPRRMASFVEWTGIVGGIVAAAGFGDAFAPALLADAGDKWQVEFDTLFAGVVRRFTPTVAGVSIPLPEWCAVAREHGLYVDKLGDLELTLAIMEQRPSLWKVPDTDFTDAVKLEQAKRYMDPQKQAGPWAKILRKRLGRLVQVDGRTYRFSDRNTSTSTFVVYLVEGTPAAAAGSLN